MFTFHDIPYQNPKQAKWSEQYRRMIDTYKRICRERGHDSAAADRAYARLLQAKQLISPSVLTPR